MPIFRMFNVTHEKEVVPDKSGAASQDRHEQRGLGRKPTTRMGSVSVIHRGPSGGGTRADGVRSTVVASASAPNAANLISEPNE